MISFQRVFFTLAVMSLSLVFQNCSRASFSAADEDLSSQTMSTSTVLKTMQPALAVRGLTCVLCHGEIRSNVLTDFGYGTSDFLGGNKHFYSEGSWFNNLAGAWQSSHITGTVFVPKLQVTRKAQDVLGPAYQNRPLLSIKEFLKVPMEITYRDHITEDETHAPMIYHLTPAAGAEPIVEKEHIQISAPSEGQIRSLAPELWASASISGAKRAGSRQALQLFTAGNPGQTYTRNGDAVLECANSDIVIRGTLLLRHLKVNAAGGCRFYVSGTVFIEDEITYVGTGQDQNLQITSASAVMMGLSTTTIDARMKDRRDLQLSTRDYDSLAAQILQESKNIGNLKDGVAADSTRASYDYKSLLLNAPIVHSRYLGMLQGTIISEGILFTLGKFHFVFDPVFAEVPVLPLLPTPVLTVR